MEKKLVRNSKKFWPFIRSLRNHPNIRSGFVQQSHISEKDHENFMAKYNDCFYICLVDDNPAGYVGVIDDDIRVATHPDYQGRGVGKFMIKEISCKYNESYAKIKLENHASIALFESCGFKKKYFILEQE